MMSSSYNISVKTKWPFSEIKVNQYLWFCLFLLSLQKKLCMNSMPPQSASQTPPPCGPRLLLCPTDKQGDEKRGMFKKGNIPNSLCPATVALCRLYKTHSAAEPESKRCLLSGGLWLLYGHQPSCSLHLSTHRHVLKHSGNACSGQAWRAQVRRLKPPYCSWTTFKAG